MAKSNVEKAYDILKTYCGPNPQIKTYKTLYESGKLILNEFQVKYIISNHNYLPFEVNKVFKISPELGKEIYEKNGLEFVPEKIKITTIIGELYSTYHCYVQYRQSVPPILMFLKRKFILGEPKVIDPSSIIVDFDRFDKMTEKDGRRLKDHQKSAVRFMLANKKCILADSMGLGKLLANYELIPTALGFKKIGDILPSDIVYGSNGKPYNVTGIYPHKSKDIYRITFTDGTYTDCGLEHLWIVRTMNDKRRGRGWKVKSTQELIDSGLEWSNGNENKGHVYKYEIPLSEPVQYPAKKHFIAPYMLGVLIGDGSLTNGRVVVSIAEQDSETADRLSTLITDDYIIKRDDYSSCPRYAVIKNHNRHTNDYVREIKRLGLNVLSGEKFIPDEYMIDSIENRLELLRGLMDTDGYITKTKNKTSFSTSSERLAKDIQSLVNSLGGIARFHQYERKDKETIDYVVTVVTKENPFHLSRRKKLYNPTFKKSLVRRIMSIEYVGNCDATCISVDSPDHSYLCTKNYIVTHNTTSSIVASMAAESKKTLIITTASLKSTWKRELMLYNPPEDIEIIKDGKKWKDNAKFIIINYELLQKFYKVPQEQAIEVKQLKMADGSFQEVRVPVYIKDKKTGHLKPKMVKSTKKATIAECMKDSPLYQTQFDCVIVDEAQKLSNNTSIRYKVIDDFIKRSGINYVFLLTGTPLTNKPMNLYRILKLLNASVTDDYKFYCERYCGGWEMKLKTGKTIMMADGATHLDELRERIKHLYIRRLISDLPDMVHKEISTRYYDLDDKQQAKYDQLWNEYTEAQKNIGKEDTEQYRQLVEGILVRQYLAQIMIPNTIQLADEIIDDGEKVIIVCTFQEELDMFKKHYGDKCVCYDGRMSVKQKDDAEKAFMNDPKVKVFVGNINASSLGLTLTVAKKMIFNSYSWEEITNRQMQDRIWRITQTDDVECIYQLYTDSISQHMFNSVIRKGMIMDEVIKSENDKTK